MAGEWMAVLATISGCGTWMGVCMMIFEKKYVWRRAGMRLAVPSFLACVGFKSAWDLFGRYK